MLIPVDPHPPGELRHTAPVHIPEWITISAALARFPVFTACGLTAADVQRGIVPVGWQPPRWDGLIGVPPRWVVGSRRCWGVDEKPDGFALARFAHQCIEPEQWYDWTRYVRFWWQDAHTGCGAQWEETPIHPEPPSCNDADGIHCWRTLNDGGFDGDFGTVYEEWCDLCGMIRENTDTAYQNVLGQPWLDDQAPLSPMHRYLEPTEESTAAALAFRIDLAGDEDDRAKRKQILDPVILALRGVYFSAAEAGSAGCCPKGVRRWAGRHLRQGRVELSRLARALVWMPLSVASDDLSYGLRQMVQYAPSIGRDLGRLHDGGCAAPVIVQRQIVTIGGMTRAEYDAAEAGA